MHGIIFLYYTGGFISPAPLWSSLTFIIVCCLFHVWEREGNDWVLCNRCLTLLSSRLSNNTGNKLVCYFCFLTRPSAKSDFCWDCFLSLLNASCQEFSAELSSDFCLPNILLPAKSFLPGLSPILWFRVRVSCRMGKPIENSLDRKEKIGNSFGKGLIQQIPRTAAKINRLVYNQWTMYCPARLNCISLPSGLFTVLVSLIRKCTFSMLKQIFFY